MLCMSLLQTFPQNFEIKRLISLKNIKITDISIILEHCLKCVINKIVVKMLGKNQNRTQLTTINKNLDILAQTRS